MGLEITVRSTDRYLTTTAAVKAQLGLSTAASSQDPQIDASILRASAWAETVVGYPLVAQRYRETLAGYGSRRLMASRTPILAVPGFYFGTDTGDATAITTTEYSVDAEAGMLERSLGFEWTAPLVYELDIRPQPGQEFTPYLLDYVAGYSLTGLSTGSSLWSTAKGTTSTERTLPQDIEAAVIAKAIAYYTNSVAVVGKSVGDLSIQYGRRGAAGEPFDPAAAMLAPYRRYA